MTSIGKFIAAIRRQKFLNAIEREIKSKIFPQVKGRADHGYPFSSQDELYKERLRVALELRQTLSDLNSAGLNMPDNECNAFLYVAYRDLNERLKMYEEFARARRQYRVPAPPQPVAAAA
ncbi:MAG: hypothetical protein WBW41_11045 [Verrucomicrobiia bacterium]